MFKGFFNGATYVFQAIACVLLVCATVCAMGAMVWATIWACAKHFPASAVGLCAALALAGCLLSPDHPRETVITVDPAKDCYPQWDSTGAERLVCPVGPYPDIKPEGGPK